MFTGNEDKRSFGTILIMVLCLGAVSGAQIPPLPGSEARNPDPADGARDRSTTVTLSWEPGFILLPIPLLPCSVEYDVYFGTNSTPGEAQYKGRQAGTSYGPGDLDECTTYYWQIDTVVTCTGGAEPTVTMYEGHVWSFTTGPEEAHDPSPADEAVDVGLGGMLSWSAGCSAMAHDVYLGTNPTPGAAEFVGRLSITMYWHTPGFAPCTTYYWRVNEVEADANSVHTGEVWSFTTGPEEARNPSPADGATDVPVDVVLSWSGGCSTDWHEVYFGTNYSEVQDGTGDTYKGSQDWRDCSYRPAALDLGQEYFWRISEVVDLVGDEPMIYPGEVWRFTTESLPTVGKATDPYPADEAVDVPTDVVLSWSAGEGAEQHDVYIGTGYVDVLWAHPDSTEYRGRQEACRYDPEGLERCTTYYWKINEVAPMVNSPPIICEGNVWEFSCIPCLEEFEFGDAPDNGTAYPDIWGEFPTCTAGQVIRHSHSPDPSDGAWFGPSRDFETDGNAGLCSFPPYDQDELFMDGDAGLMFPHPYTLEGPWDAQRIVNCPGRGGPPLGFVCETAKWGHNIDILAVNYLPDNKPAYVNVLVDWNQDGVWSARDSDLECAANRWTFVQPVMNWRVPNGYVGPLSGLGPPDFLIGPKDGYVWVRCTITDEPVPLGGGMIGWWNGEGDFAEGETEDYLLYIAPAPLDFGDAPEAESCQSQLPGYPTKLANNGAYHLIVGGPNTPSGIYLGDGVDADQDGQPNAKATGDDEDSRVGTLNFDDEDGVVFTSGWVLGQTATVDVNANVAGFLDTWVDFDADGSWDEPDDQIFASEPLDAGINSLTFQVPATAAPNVRTYARFRFSTTGQLLPFGPAANGEVEDYAVFLVKPPVEHLKWSQPPIEWMPTGRTPVYCGWDEPAFRGALEYPGAPVRWRMVADDFRCLGSMPITSIHWWGSYLDWHEPNLPDSAPEAFHMAIWTNVAASRDPCVPFNHPGRLLWESRCDHYDWNFAGYDRFGALIADNPTIRIDPNLEPGGPIGPPIGPIAEFDWLAWRGWWVRGQSTRIEFTFTGIDTAAIPGDQVLLKLNLGVTNHLNGEKGLDGLALITIGGPGGPPYTLPTVLLDNLDAENCIHGYEGTGTYETTASILVDKDYIRDGTLTIVLYRNGDLTDTAPAAPVGQCLPIDMSMPIPTVPGDCYDGDDARTVHIHIETTDDTGEVAASGEVTLWVPGCEIENEPVAPSGIRSAKAISETCFQYYVELEPEDYFWQEDYVDDTEDHIFWLSVTALYREGPWPPDYPWGWKTRPWHWMEDAVTFELEPDERTSDVVLDPNAITPIDNAQVCEAPESYDVAFELDTDPNYIKWEQPYDSVHHWPHHEPALSTLTTATEGTIAEPVTKWTQRPDVSTGMAVNTTNNQEHFPEMGAQMLADDWQCEQRTPVTAAVWWGSYMGYGYEACRCQNMAPPAKPDCFLLSIWTDVPDPNPGDPGTYGHPGEKIWEYKAYDYDEVLVGYDKHPHEEPNEAVFRYSVRIPEPAWFNQENINEVYWFSVAAMYEGQDEPAYSWGWTNHKHVFNDDAVTGYLASTGIEPVWKWYELHDQTRRSEDMSFILFTQPH